MILEKFLALLLDQKTSLASRFGVDMDDFFSGINELAVIV